MPEAYYILGAAIQCRVQCSTLMRGTGGRSQLLVWILGSRPECQDRGLVSALLNQSIPHHSWGRLWRLQEVGPYIYVYILGTRPECQNRGLGTALMKHIHAIADSRSLPCYLEVCHPFLSQVQLAGGTFVMASRNRNTFVWVLCLGHPLEISGMHRTQMAAMTSTSSKANLLALQSSSEGSRRLYERLGYHVRETVYMDKGAPPLYLMSRPASSAGCDANAAGAAWTSNET